MSGPITDLVVLAREYAVEGWTWEIIRGGPCLVRGWIALSVTDYECDPPGVEWVPAITVGCAHLGVPTPWRAAERLEEIANAESAVSDGFLAKGWEGFADSHAQVSTALARAARMLRGAS